MASKGEVGIVLNDGTYSLLIGDHYAGGRLESLHYPSGYSTTSSTLRYRTSYLNHTKSYHGPHFRISILCLDNRHSLLLLL